MENNHWVTLMSKAQLRIETLFVIISILLIGSAFVLQRFDTIDEIYASGLFGLSFLIGGFFKAKEGVLDTIKDKSLNVEILMILAAVGAFVVGEFQEGAILILIFSVSGVLESYTTARSEKELTSLLKLAPDMAIRLVDGVEVEVEVSSIQVGDQVIVKVGQLIPVDGTIVTGQTSIDESTITGEFVPVSKRVSQSVYAGSINLESAIVVECTVDPKQSVVQKIIDFVAQAQASETTSQTLIGRIEKIYVYVVIALAITFMVVPPLFGWLSASDAFYRGIIVLVVGSPCALVASITPAMLAALSNGAKQRILIKGGQPLEQLLSIQAVVFDKTGTITDGTPKLMQMSPFSEEDKVVIASMEARSNHPLAKAIVTAMSEVTPVVMETSELSGQGMSGEHQSMEYHIGRFDYPIPASLKEAIQAQEALGYTVVTVFKQRVCIGYLSLQDQVRKGVAQTMDALHAKGIRTIMLTGDNAPTAKAIADRAHIQQVEAGLFPEDKVAFIKTYQARYGAVMMVGDGINDAPALATADVSVAMGSATDVSLETSDIVLMNNQLDSILKLFRLSKRTRRVTLQNVIFSVSVIAVLMVSNVFGLIELPAGVVAHETSTILVILNSLRLLTPVIK
jgi:Zn2+/Cd2+-exporting ATPase